MEATTTAGAAVDVALSCTDPADSLMIFKVDRTPDDLTALHGTATVPTAHLPMLRYVPEPGYAGVDVVSFHAESVNGDSAPRQLLVNISGPPSVDVTAPAEGATYAAGADVAAAFTCTECVLSTLKPGAEGCAGTVATGASIDTAVTGQKTFTVTAEGDDGQTATKTVTYTVGKASTTTTAESSSNPSTAGAPVTYTATVAAGITAVASTTGTRRLQGRRRDDQRLRERGGERIRHRSLHRDLLRRGHAPRLSLQDCA